MKRGSSMAHSKLKWEIKFTDWITSHILELSIVISIILSIFLRYSTFEHVSNDASVDLLSWFDAIRQEGGFKALYRQIGNYNIPYQTVFAFLTYLPIKPLYSIKIVSCIFDYALAFSAYRFVLSLTEKNKFKATIAFIVTLFLPIVFLNSATWAQCDSIFTFFTIMSLYKLSEDKEVSGFIFLGLAFSFKLQAVFILPFIIFLYLYSKRISILHFLLVPITMMITSIGGLFFGRGFKEVLYVYYKQTGTFHYITLSYPGFGSIIANNCTKDFYELLSPSLTILTIIVLGVTMAYILKQNRKLTRSILLKIAFLITYSCVFFLPSMHERYDYIYLLIGLIVCFIDYRFIPIEIILNYISTRLYANYLFGTQIHDFGSLGLLNLVCLSFTFFIVIKDINKSCLISK